MSPDATVSPAPASDAPDGGPTVVEVAIVGGGPAGLSAALVLGRARRSVLVIDAAEPGHFAADAVHGFLGQENVPPRELRRRVWEQLEPFDVARRDGKVVGAEARPGAGLQGLRGATPVEHGFALTLDDGSVVEAAVVLLAGGVHFGVLDVPGLAALWGSRLFHCPFCHGWEAVGKRVGVLGPAMVQQHLLPLLALWADDLQGFLVGDAAAPAGAGGEVSAGVDGGGAAEGDAGEPVVAFVARDGEEVVVTFTDGTERRVDVLFAPPVLSAVDGIPEQLGLTHTVASPLAAEPLGLAVDPMTGATTVPGVYAAGDLAGGQPAVAVAVQSGQSAAVGIVRALIGHP